MNPTTNIPEIDTYVTERIAQLPTALAAAIRDIEVSNWLTNTLQQFQLTDVQIQLVKNEVLLILMLLEPLEDLQVALITECDISLEKSFQIVDRLNRDFFQPNLNLLKEVPTEQITTFESIPPQKIVSEVNQSVHYAPPATPVAPTAPYYPPTTPLAPAAAPQYIPPVPVSQPVMGTVPQPPVAVPQPPAQYVPPLANPTPTLPVTPIVSATPVESAAITQTPTVGYAAAQVTQQPVTPTPQANYIPPTPLTRSEVEASLSAKRTMAEDINRVQPQTPVPPIDLSAPTNAPIPQYATPLTYNNQP